MEAVISPARSARATLYEFLSVSNPIRAVHILFSQSYVDSLKINEPVKGTVRDGLDLLEIQVIVLGHVLQLASRL